MDAMLHYVAPVPEIHATWLSSQFEEIQLQCLASLPVLAPLFMEDLTTQEVIGRLSKFLNWCLATDQEFKGIIFHVQIQLIHNKGVQGDS